MNVKVSVRARLTILYDLVFLLGLILLGISAYVGLQSTIALGRTGSITFLLEHVSRLPAGKLQQDLSVHVALKPALLVVQNPAADLLYCGTSVRALCGSLSMHVSPFFTTIRD
jgi:hypothetical protein